MSDVFNFKLDTQPRELYLFIAYSKTPIMMEITPGVFISTGKYLTTRHDSLEGLSAPLKTVR